MGGFDPSAMQGGMGGFDRNAAGSSLQPMSMGGGFDPSAMGGNFDPSAMPEGFDPSAMPGGMGGMQMPVMMPDAMTSATPEAEDSAETVQAGAADSQRPQQGSGRGNSGNFGGMQMPTNSVTSNILPLVLSFAVMAAALIFAFAYKRKS